MIELRRELGTETVHQTEVDVTEPLREVGIEIEVQNAAGVAVEIGVGTETEVEGIEKEMIGITGEEANTVGTVAGVGIEHVTGVEIILEIEVGTAHVIAVEIVHVIEVLNIAVTGTRDLTETMMRRDPTSEIVKKRKIMKINL